MNTKAIIEADLTLIDGVFQPHVQVEVDASGRIARVGKLGLTPTLRLVGRALAPGMVNAHSHAFQRGLRGRGETFGDVIGSFWSWRDEMYKLVDSLDADSFYELCLLAFSEMRSGGVTSVGEFHYLRHDASCEGFRFDDVVLSAAQDAGIRLALLCVYYNTGGFNQPLTGAQRRFRSASTNEYWRCVDATTDRLTAPAQTVGAVAHSVRAASIDDIAQLHAESQRRGMVFHMHVEEQRREIQECISACEQSPMSLLCDRLDIDDRFTAVHCTHTDPLDMERFLTAGGSVCVCPITEANLGDGVADLQSIAADGGRVCVGSDSNSRLCMTEELRWLEYVQRLDAERRGVLTDEHGSAAAALWQIATVNGAHTLGVETGRIDIGLFADFLTLDLSSRALRGASPDTLLDTFVFGAGEGVVASTCVGGNWKESAH